MLRRHLLCSHQILKEQQPDGTLSLAKFRTSSIHMAQSFRFQNGAANLACQLQKRGASPKVQQIGQGARVVDL